MFILANDPFNGKSKVDQNRWVFIGNNKHVASSVLSDTEYSVWSKPEGCNFIKIMCVGGGEAGLTGDFGTATTGRYGGGGGNSGQIAHGLWPAAIFPDRVYVRAGFGGAPSGSTTVTYGGASSISIVPVRFEEAATEPARRANGTVTLLCALGGTSATLTNQADYYRLGLSGTIQVHQSTLGNKEGQGFGRAIAGGGNQTSGFILYITRDFNTNFLCGGGSGSGAISGVTIQDGGFISSTAPVPYRQGGVSGSSGSGQGGNGFFVWGPPMFGIGGGGGKGVNSGSGSGGGNGGMGCGGGGGGAGVSAGGAGGYGGPGFVIIEVF